ncbi:MAG TPA: hypothetical protein VJI68_03140 [Candidatus Nanoarchaeia archaeon]|nr:hypothetical protein [Candidatus Nanoarchaeia archaeon]
MKEQLKKIWHFIWHDDSALSWIVNILLAFIIVKFLFYPGLGLIFGTTHPVVAVVSGSMEHNGLNFNEWWSVHRIEYSDFNITEENFKDYKFINGFNKGDLMILFKPKEIKQGDVIVFWGSDGEPIIHRTVLSQEIGGYIQTKGDNNKFSRADEINISESRLIGKAVLRVPYLGWPKILLFDLFRLNF